MTEHKEKVKPLESADLTTVKQQAASYKYWRFTLNEVEGPSYLDAILQHECKWFIFQEEKDEDGTLCVRGTLCLLKRQRLSALKPIDPEIHWEPTKSIKPRVAHIIANQTRCGRQWVYGIEDPIPSKREIIKISEPYGWQLEVLDIISKKPHPRTVHWFWEPNGGVGKSALCKYLGARHNATLFMGSVFHLCKFLSKNPDRRKIIMYDIPRSSRLINYAALHDIKAGVLHSGAYKGNQLMFPRPHLFVFASKEPDYTALSADCWHVVRIQC